MEDEKEYRYRISILKFSGSVWMEEYDDLQSILKQIEVLLHKHPHLLISRQRVADKNDR